MTGEKWKCSKQQKYGGKCPFLPVSWFGD